MYGKYHSIRTTSVDRKKSSIFVISVTDTPLFPMYFAERT
jgi:hypothetical protein